MALRRAKIVGFLALAAAFAVTAPASAREPREWALFDPDLSKRRTGYSVGAAGIRDRSDVESELGLTLEVWGSLRTTRGLTFAELRQSVVVRGFHGPTFVAGLTHALHAGVELGTFDIGTGVGFTPIGADLSHGRLSLDLLSPEASILLGFEVGAVSFAFRGYLQYLARVFGREDAIVHGLTLDVGSLVRASQKTKRVIEPYYR